MGAVARDSEDKVLFSVVRRMRARWPSNIAEAKAIHLAVGWAIKQGLLNVIIESDSQVIVSRLSKSTIFSSDLDAFWGDILHCCSKFSHITFSHVKRDGNQLAHCLVKVMPFGIEQC